MLLQLTGSYFFSVTGYDSLASFTALANCQNEGCGRLPTTDIAAIDEISTVYRSLIF